MLYCSSAYLELESSTGELGSFTGVFIPNYAQEPYNTLPLSGAITLLIG